MENSSLRLAALREYLRGSLWVMPSLAVVAVLALGTGLAAVSLSVVPGGRPQLGVILFGGGPDAARGLLSTVAGSVITITSVTFSLTVVALQLAASNYSPRLLQGFLRDRGNQAVLSVFLATFAYSYAVLRTIRSDTADQEGFVPVVAVNVLLLFVLATLAALVYFIHHITQLIRVETIISGIVNDTLQTIRRAHPRDDPDAPDGARAPLPQIPDEAKPVLANRSGYVQAVEPESLVQPAAEADLVVRLRALPGEHVTAGTALGWTWAARADAAAGAVREIDQAVEAAFQLGKERTLQQDAAFGLRQLVDIALRAVSPGVNDPTTASQAIDALAELLTELATRSSDGRHLHDGDGRLRVVAPTRDFSDYLALACDQVRAYGGGDLQVVGHLLRLLRDVGSVARTSERRRDVERQIERLVAVARADLQLDEEVADVERMAAEAREALGASQQREPSAPETGS